MSGEECQLKGQEFFEMGPIGCPETSLRTYHYTQLSFLAVWISIAAAWSKFENLITLESSSVDFNLVSKVVELPRGI
jgi:hypothetical protein